MICGKSENNPLKLKSTKQCICGNDRLIKLMSLKRKICNQCDTWIFWDLDENQEPLL